MKSVWSRILCIVVSLCLILPALGCGSEVSEEEDTTPYYASVVTRDEPEEDATAIKNGFATTIFEKYTPDKNI